jgi:hypothetical protein
MGYTNFPNGITSYGVPIHGSGLLGPLGLGCGDIFWLVASKSSNSFYDKLIANGIPDNKIYTTLATAYAATTSGQNDVVVVMPGTYTVTASLTWANHNTHLVGVGGRSNRGGMGASVYFNNATADVEQLIKVNGDNCQFHGIYLRNAGADAQCYTALKVHEGENFYAEGCQFVGHAAATQVDTAATSSLWFYTDSSGKPWGATFVNCRIGSGSETIRTDGSTIYASGSAALTAKYITFEDCVIESYSDTAANPAVLIAANYSIDRYMLFKRCLFYNYSVNHAQSATQVINDDCGTTHEIVMMDSYAVGYTDWDADGIGYTYHNRPADNSDNGIMEKAQ